MSIKSFVCAAFCGLVCSSESFAQSVAPPSVDSWLGSHFQSVVTQCVPRTGKDPFQLKKGKKLGDFIPPRLASEDFFKRSLVLPYRDLSGVSMERVFGAILPKDAKFESLKVGNQFLPVDYALVDTPLVAKGMDAWRVRTDCSLAINAAMTASLKKQLILEEVVAAIAADADNGTKNQFEIVYGTFESPFYRNFGPISASTTSASIVNSGLLLWKYRVEKPEEKSRLIASFKGIARYRAAQSGGNFKTTADFRIGPGGQPIMKATGQTDASTSLELTSFGAIALLDGSEELMDLPTAQQIAKRVANQQVFELVDYEPVKTDKEATATAELYKPRRSIEYSVASPTSRQKIYQFSSAIPENMCAREWQSSDSNIAELAWVGYVKGQGPGGQSGCVFWADYTRSTAKAISAKVKLVKNAGEETFELPLQTVGFRQIQSPRLTYNRNKSSDRIGTISTTGVGLAAQTTWTWTYAFDITQSNNPNDAVKAVKPEVVLKVDQSCIATNPFDATASAELQTDASGQDNLLVTFSRTIGANSAEAIQTRPVACLLSVEATALIGPDGAAVGFETPKEERIFIHVVDDQPASQVG